MTDLNEIMIINVRSCEHDVQKQISPARRWFNSWFSLYTLCYTEINTDFGTHLTYIKEHSLKIWTKWTKISYTKLVII